MNKSNREQDSKFKERSPVYATTLHIFQSLLSVIEFIEAELTIST